MHFQSIDAENLINGELKSMNNKILLYTHLSGIRFPLKNNQSGNIEFNLLFCWENSEEFYDESEDRTTNGKYMYRNGNLTLNAKRGIGEHFYVLMYTKNAVTETVIQN